MLRDAIEAERAECDQDADCARINVAIELAKKDFAALENRELDPEDIKNNGPRFVTKQFLLFAMCVTILSDAPTRPKRPRDG